MSLPIFFLNLFNNNNVDTSNISFKSVKGLPDTIVLNGYEIVVNTRKTKPQLSVLSICPLEVKLHVEFNVLDEEYYERLINLVKLYNTDDNEYHLYI